MKNIMVRVVLGWMTPWEVGCHRMLALISQLMVGSNKSQPICKRNLLTSTETK